MRKSTYLFAVFVMLMLWPVTANSKALPQHRVKWPNTKSIQISEYLEATAARLDFYYTTESVLSSTGYGTFDNYHIIPNPKATTLPALVVALRKQMPNVVVFIDKHNPKILHLVDDTLTDYTEYPLDKKANIQFSGNITDLPDQIGKATGLALYTKDTSSITGFKPYLISVSASTIEVRSILTDSVVLSPKHRLIWLAQTYQTLRGPIITNVTYP